MHTCIYKEKRTMMRWDDDNIIGYLNEEVINDYKPENLQEGEEPEPCTGYSYTGELPDGGTVMPCKNMTDYRDVANAIIRSKYTQSEENAIQRHAINGEYKDDSSEYDEYNEWCTKAVATAKLWVKSL